MPRSRLRPHVDLPAPDALVESVRWRLKLLVGENVALGTTPDRRAEIDEQLRIITEYEGLGAVADAAVIKLCKLDPLFLGTELVIAKLMDWKLIVIFGDIKPPAATDTAAGDLARAAKAKKAKSAGGPARATAKAKSAAGLARATAREVERVARIENAKDKLDELKRAVRFVSGSGQKGYRLRREIKSSFDFYVDVFTRIRNALRSSFTEANVRMACELYGLPDALVRRVKNAERVEGLVDEYLGKEYGISKDRTRLLRSG